VPLVLMLRVLPCGDDDDDDDDEAGSMRETKRKHNASKQLHHAHIASTRECSCSSVDVAWLGTVHGNERGVGRFEEAVAVVVRSHSPPPFREAPKGVHDSQFSAPRLA